MATLLGCEQAEVDQLVEHLAEDPLRMVGQRRVVRLRQDDARA